MANIQDFMRLYKETPLGSICKSDYEAVQVKVCEALRPGMDREEVRKVIEEDWKRDTKGAGELRKEQLFDSLFELCDTWCPSLLAEEYVSFFAQLQFRLLYSGQQNDSAYDILTK